MVERCYEGIVAKLKEKGTIKEISDELRLYDTFDKKVLFVYKVIEDLGAFPKVQESKKDDNLSEHFRNLGNTWYQHSKYQQAWQYYNLSLLNATLGSETYCLALSNRSAAFYELRKYKECLKDIEKILSFDCPNKILNKLLNRQKMCNEALKNKAADVDLETVVQMEYPKDSRYVAASCKLQVTHTDELGRHVISKANIKVGEVLAEEEPYFSLLLKSQLLCGCNYCLARGMNLAPCETCCFALYCNNDCKEKAWKDYHSFECPLMLTLYDMDFTKLELLALRTVLRARQDHANWDGLFKTIKDADENFDTEYRGHVKVNKKWVYDSKYYTPIHTLATNIENRLISDVFQKCVSAAILLKFLETDTNFLNANSDEDKEKIRSTVAGLLLLHLMTSPTNMHGISSNIEKLDGTFLEEAELGSAPYAFLSLLNHSCAPNVVRFSKLGTSKIILMAIRPIKKGMQILDNYGPHHALDNRPSRHDTLTFQYKFTCMCEACLQNWPTYYAMSSMLCSTIPMNLSKAKKVILNPEAVDKLKRGDFNFAKKIFKQLCSMCEMLEQYSPNLELCDCQETFKQCVCIFLGLSPYGHTQKIDWQDMLPLECESRKNRSGKKK